MVDSLNNQYHMFQIGDIIYCGGCAKPVPLAKRVGREDFELIKFFQGEKIAINVSYDGMYTITCEKCGFGHKFANIKEEISLNDTLAVSET